MHSARRFFVNSLMAAALVAGCPLGQAVPVTSLYVVMVPAADPQQAAQTAMRVELVRLTGTREAASDPALAPLIDNARQYVQLERSTTSGDIQVLFDEPALSAAIGAAGRSLWGPDRPLLWIELPQQQDTSIAATWRARLTAAAQERGLPITIVTASALGAAGATGAPATTPGATGGSPVLPASAPVSAAAPATVAPATVPGATPLTPQLALDTARTAGASAALIAQLIPDNPGSLQWTLVSADTGGQWVGGPELAIDNATDMLSSAARALAQAPVAQYDCQIVGVNDLPSLVNVLAAVHSAPGVTDVAVSDVSGDALTLHVQARGSDAQVERALASERLQPTGPGTNGLLEYRYVAPP